MTSHVHPTPPNSTPAPHHEPPFGAVFFDLGDTLGTATVGGHPPRLVRFDVFPFLLPSANTPGEPGLLAALRARGLRLGAISNTGNERAPAINAVLEPTGLLAALESELLVYSADEGVTKASREIFDRAAGRAGLPPARCLFVGEDSAERAVAVSAGWRVCPHPLLIGEMLDGQQLRFVRLRVPAAQAASSWRELLKKQPFVPQHFADAGGSTVYGLTSQRGARALMNMRFGVELLGEPGLPATHDLFLLRDDLAVASGFGTAEGAAAAAFATPTTENLLLASERQGAIAALPHDRGPDALHFERAKHGHNLRLIPDSLLWESPTATALAGLESGSAAADTPPSIPETVAADLRRIDEAAVLRTVQRYSGQIALDGTAGGSRIHSRHIAAGDGGNSRAVEQLVADLEAIGGGKLAVKRHRFSFSGRTLYNVEAELTGDTAELVLVTAHLDSTAAADAGFDPAHGPAPGADDDASGIAAVLAIAERLVALTETTPLSRTVRFVLFNAEEQGLIGSAAYARRSKARGEAIAAVWQMDMIGFNATAPRDWEIHAGFSASATVEASSRRLAELLAGAAAELGGLPAPQILHSASAIGDPAEGRSDHAPFQGQGYPACVVSEDFFVDAAGASEPDANPNYHGSGDTQIDPRYAAAIARAVAGAAWLSATRTSAPQPLARSPATSRR